MLKNSVTESTTGRLKISPEIRIVTQPAFYADIYIAGDIHDARRILRRYCLRVGLCVNVTETDFIYTGGAERGVKVGLVNYPRFPSTPDAIKERALDLARTLIIEMCQTSALVQTPSEAVWLTRREE